MRIAKLGHSCCLVEAGSGERILIDPGSYSTVPDDVVRGCLDAVLLTHAHADHIEGELLGRIEASHPGIAIYGSMDIVEDLAGKGVKARDHGFSGFSVGETGIEVLQAGHDPVLGPVPENAAYRIGGELVVTGDSTAISLDAWAGTRVLLLPTSAPWASRPALANLVERLKPEVAIPVHDGYLVDSFRAAQDRQFEAFARERGVAYLVPGPELEDA